MIPALATRTHELDQIIDEYADEARVVLRRIVVAPAQRRGFPRACTSEELDRVGHLAIGRDPSVGDDRLGFLVREHRRAPPLGILVDQRSEVALVEHARRLLDEVGSALGE
jgi:hypothetical protein